MKIITLLFLILIGENGQAFVQTTTKNLKTQIEINVQDGHRTTRLLITKKKKEFWIEIQGNQRTTQKRKLSRNDFKYFLSEFEKLPLVKTNMKACEASKVDIVFTKASGQTQKKSSCILVKPLRQPAYTRFINIAVWAL